MTLRRRKAPKAAFEEKTKSVMAHTIADLILNTSRSPGLHSGRPIEEGRGARLRILRALPCLSHTKIPSVLRDQAVAKRLILGFYKIKPSSADSNRYRMGARRICWRDRLARKNTAWPWTRICVAWAPAKSSIRARAFVGPKGKPEEITSYGSYATVRWAIRARRRRNSWRYRSRDSHSI